MDIQAAGIMAGGRGSRLFGAEAGSKAMVSVLGRPLIDHILSDIHAVGVRRLLVVVRPDDRELMDALEDEERFAEIEVVHQPDNYGGTLGAVRCINEALGSRPYLLSTCDVVSARNEVQRLFKAATTCSGREALLLLVSKYICDDTPIWVHSTREGVVTAMGKGIEPAEKVFANVRVVLPRFTELLEQTEMALGGRDTQMMAKLVQMFPGSVRAILAGDVLDVDDWEDVRAAEEVLLAGRGDDNGAS